MTLNRFLIFFFALISLSCPLYGGEIDDLLTQVHSAWLKNNKQYATKQMSEEYKAKDSAWGVDYWNETERQRWEMKFEGDKVVLPSGLPPSQTSSGGLVVTTADGSFQPTSGLLMYALTADGHFYVYPTKAQKLQHSTFLAGQPIAAAGMIHIIDGKVKYIDNSSGHYEPSPYYLAQALHALHGKQINLEGTRVGIKRGNGSFNVVRYGSTLHVVTTPQRDRCEPALKVMAGAAF